MKRLHITKMYIFNDIVLKVIDLDKSTKTRALRALRKAIRESDFINKDIYADECYTVIDGVASSRCINLDLAKVIIENLSKEYDLVIREL